MLGWCTGSYSHYMTLVLLCRLPARRQAMPPMEWRTPSWACIPPTQVPLPRLCTLVCALMPTRALASQQAALQVADCSRACASSQLGRPGDQRQQPSIRLTSSACRDALAVQLTLLSHHVACIAGCMCPIQMHCQGCSHVTCMCCPAGPCANVPLSTFGACSANACSVQCPVKIRDRQRVLALTSLGSASHWLHTSPGHSHPALSSHCLHISDSRGMAGKLCGLCSNLARFCIPLCVCAGLGASCHARCLAFALCLALIASQLLVQLFLLKMQLSASTCRREQP